jgi:hypothetical protein
MYEKIFRGLQIRYLISRSISDAKRLEVVPSPVDLEILMDPVGIILLQFVAVALPSRAGVGDRDIMARETKISRHEDKIERYQALTL